MRISQAVDSDAAETSHADPARCGLSVSADRSAQQKRHPENEPTDPLANAFSSPMMGSSFTQTLIEAIIPVKVLFWKVFDSS